MSRLDRLEKGKPVAQLGSVLGSEFPRGLLERIAAEMTDDLQGGLDELTEAGLLYRSGRTEPSVYSFKHALIQDTAYQSLLKSSRRALHQATAEALERYFPERIESEPEFVALHYDRAGSADEAIAHYRRAGEREASRHASVEAIRHFDRALALLRERSQTEDRDRDELSLLFALGGQLVATRGYGSPEVSKTYERARALCERTKDKYGLLRALGGLCAVFTNLGRFDQAARIAQEQLSLAEAIGDRKMIQRGHSALGSSLGVIGEHTKAREHMAQGLALYRREWHRPYAAQDPGVAVGTQAAVNLWSCGFPDQALATAREATRLALEVEHPFSIALGLVHEAVVHQYRGETEAVLRKAEDGVEISEEHSILYLSGMALAWKGAAIGETDPETGVELLSLGSERMKAAGGVAWRVYHKGLIARLLARQGFHDRARESFHPPARTERDAFTPELLRLYGEILSLAGDATEANGYFVRALEVAQKNDAKSLALRAATSLARVWQSQGKTAEARGLLASVYDWFTEGFDTQDLKDAKTLLEELG